MQRLIYCEDYEQEKRRIEAGGVFRVIACEPQPAALHKQRAAKLCLIRWEHRNAVISLLRKSQLIYTDDYPAIRRVIEAGGRNRVVELRPEPGQDQKPAADRMSTIFWRRVP